MTCIIPILLTILAAEPCTVLQDAQIGWQKAEWFRMIYENLDGRAYVPHTLDDLPKPLILREEAEPWPCAFNQPCVVLANTAEYSTHFQIRFVRGKMDIGDSWTHEMRHVNCHAFTPLEYCIGMGHGSRLDPLFQILDILKRWSYPYADGHPYLPTLLPRE